MGPHGVGLRELRSADPSASQVPYVCGFCYNRDDHPLMLEPDWRGALCAKCAADFAEQDAGIAERADRLPSDDRGIALAIDAALTRAHALALASGRRDLVAAVVALAKACRAGDNNARRLRALATARKILLRGNSGALVYLLNALAIAAGCDAWPCDVTDHRTAVRWNLAVFAEYAAETERHAARAADASGKHRVAKLRLIQGGAR
jgi:hypothetical protein